jgi:hypothetical protein
MIRRWRRAAPALAILVACGHASTNDRFDGPRPRVSPPTATGVVAGSCAMVLQFRGQDYEGMSVAIAPDLGPDLGDGVLPPCNDTGGTPGTAERVPLAELPGVSPDEAVLVRGWDDTVLVLRGLDPVPPEVQRLMTAPSCRAADSPLRLEGHWLGILGADGTTEIDLVPPYDVDLRVRTASSDRYLRAELTLRVPAALGLPITHDDVRQALWEPGNLAARVHCGGDGRFVVDEISATPGA